MEKQNWTEIIDAKSNDFGLNIAQILAYKGLLTMFVKREFAAAYKQTVLGPLWFFIQPVLTTCMFTIVFGKFAGIKTDVEPKFLFYFSGVVVWNYFADCFTKTATVFKDNAPLFGKVFFPRLIIPLSIIVSGLLRFSIQFLLFVLLVVYFALQPNTQIHPNTMLLFIPALLLIMSGFALGCGLIISALTTKYRDLSFLVAFGVQLLMYASPVIYSTTSIVQKFKVYVQINPLSGIIESFRYAFLGCGNFSINSLWYSTICMLGLLATGLFCFNRVEKTFIDTV